MVCTANGVKNISYLPPLPEPKKSIDILCRLTLGFAKCFFRLETLTAMIHIRDPVFYESKDDQLVNSQPFWANQQNIHKIHRYQRSIYDSNPMPISLSNLDILHGPLWKPCKLTTLQGRRRHFWRSESQMLHLTGQSPFLQVLIVVNHAPAFHPIMSTVV